MQIIILITSFLAAGPLCAFIEYLRWKHEYGKKDNLDKGATKLIAGSVFLLIVVSFSIYEWQSFVLLAYYSFSRGLLYDPLFNLFRGEYLDKESLTTNSKGDKRERKAGLSFAEQRILYGVLAAIFFTIYYSIK